VILFQSRHSRVATRNPATITRENPSRQTAIATGSALESRTSGPAIEIPRRDSPSTVYGFFGIIKKSRRV